MDKEADTLEKCFHLVIERSYCESEENTHSEQLGFCLFLLKKFQFLQVLLCFFVIVDITACCQSNCIYFTIVAGNGKSCRQFS